MANMLDQYGDEETAANVCGAFEQGYLPGSKSKAFTIKSKQQQEDQGELLRSIEPVSVAAVPNNESTTRMLGRSATGERQYLKVFLIDPSINQNNWGVSTETIDSNIMTALGKPLVLYKNSGKETDSPYRIPGLFDHPPMDDGNLEHTYEMQDAFRIGTIIDLVKDAKGAWWGIVEIANSGVKKALMENPEIPFFLSPAIMMRDVGQSAQNIQNWTFVHIAMVSRPAFGAMKAFVKGECSGDRELCVLRLKKASVEASGGLKTSAELNTGEENQCGFCTYKAMQELGQQAKESGSAQLLKVSKLDTTAKLIKQEVPAPVIKGDGQHVKQIEQVKSVSSHVEKSSKNQIDTNLNSNAEQIAPNGLRTDSIHTAGSDASANNNAEVQEINEINSTTVESKSGRAGQGAGNGGSENNAQGSNNQETTSKQSTTVKTQKQTANNIATKGNVVSIERSKLASLIAEKQRTKARVAQLEQELSYKEQRVVALENVNKVNTSKIAGLSQWANQQKREKRFMQIAQFIAQAPVFEGLSAEEKDEQARNLAASNKTVNQIMKDFEPLNKAALQARKQGGSASANVDEYGNITAGTLVPQDNSTIRTEDDNAIATAGNLMPFGGSGNYQTAKLVKTASAQQAQQQDEVPFAIRAAFSILGDQGVEL